MPKCMVGEATATVLASIVASSPGTTSSDIAIMANRELKLRGMRGNLTSGMVNSWVSYHPLGQEANKNGLVAATSRKRLPQWAGDGTHLADNHEQKPGELVLLTHRSGVEAADLTASDAVNKLRGLARRLPPSKQEVVTEVVRDVSTMNHFIGLQQEIIELQRRNNPTSRQMFAEAAE